MGYEFFFIPLLTKILDKNNMYIWIENSPFTPQDANPPMRFNSTWHCMTICVAKKDLRGPIDP